MHNQATVAHIKPDYKCDNYQGRDCTGFTEEIISSNVVVFDIIRNSHASAAGPVACCPEHGTRCRSTAEAQLHIEEKISTPVELSKTLSIGGKALKITSAIVHVGPEQNRGQYGCIPNMAIGQCMS